MVRLTALVLLATLVLVRPALATVANDICPPAANPCNVTTNKVVTNGSVLDFGNRTLFVNSGQLDVGNGSMEIRAGSVILGPTGRLKATAGDQGAGTVVVIASGDITIQSGTGGGDKGRIDVSSILGGGSVQLCTPSCVSGVGGGNVVIDGEIRAESGSSSFGGTVDIVAGNLTVTGPNRGIIQAFSGGSGGGGGSVSVTTAGNITVNGTMNVAGGEGGGGDVLLDAGADLIIGGTGVINANARQGLAAGDGFIVELFARGNATLGGTIDVRARGSLTGLDGSGGDADILADGTAVVTATIMTDGGDRDGDAGDIDIDAQQGVNATGAQISAKAAGGGGTVTFSSVGQVIVGAVDIQGGFSGGELIVDSGALAELRGIVLASGTGATTPVGGTIDVTGCDVTVTATGNLTTLGTEGINVLRAGDDLLVNGPLTAGTSNRLEHWKPQKPPAVNAAVNPEESVLLVTGQRNPCDPPNTSTSTSTTTSTSSTIFGATTTSTSGGSSTTSGGSSTTSSTTPTGASTTSTTLAPACNPQDPFACEDGDSCTDNVCSQGTCVSTEKVGYPAVYCRLEDIAAALADAPAENAGGPRLQQKLIAKVNKAVTKAQAAERANATGSVRGERKRLKAAGNLLRAFTQRVQRGKDKGQIEATLADELLGLGGESVTRLQGLTP